MASDKITRLKAREILDSRGNPTVEVEIHAQNHIKCTASVPSGASTGTHEAFELRDGGKRYGGRGVLKAVENVNVVISKYLEGKGVSGQRAVDSLLWKLDGSNNKSNLGANAILGASMVVSRAAAAQGKKPLYLHLKEQYEEERGASSKKFILPIPMMNVLNGGKHAGMEFDVQETMVMPTGAKTFSEGLQIGTEVYHCLKGILKKKFGAQATLVGDEGGFAPKIPFEEKLELLSQAIEQAGYEPKAKIAVDAAASEFFEKACDIGCEVSGCEGTYCLGGRKMQGGELIDYYASLSSKYKIISLEDGLQEDDWDSWVELNKKLGKKIQVVGDDLLTTNPARIKTALGKKACNALLLKINQIGTLSESFDAASISQKSGWNVVVSHRSGETEDAFIADLAVGLSCGQIKTGAPARSERVAKYNRLLKIEAELKDAGKIVGYGCKIPR